MTDQPHYVVQPPHELWEWIKDRADHFYQGDVDACVVSLLEAAKARHEHYAAAGFEPGQEPADPWAPLEANIKPRWPQT